ncbi:MAG: signal peptide peptidase SppA [Wenzhouxiangellaceae bacterium]|nr:signal peptide peptidase SppA [Wenzhouxiangellaceae bacterium]
MVHNRKSPFLVRLWLGFWRGLTAFRIAVFNLLFLLVLALVLRALLPGEPVAEIEPDTTLVLQPSGLIVEQYTSTPVQRLIDEALGQAEAETRLRDLLEALDRAAEDERITQVLLTTDSLLGVSPATLSELADAFERFRASGKPVIAWAGGLEQGSYALASLADEVWLHPDGFALIEGYAYYRNFFREALDKLKVDVNLFRVGQFKSAMEPFIRDSMSEADRAAAELFIGGLWQAYLDLVSTQRGIPLELLGRQIEATVARIEASDGDTALAALEAGLIDRLMTRPEARAELARRGAADAKTGFRRVSMEKYLEGQPGQPSSKPRVGILVAEGAITEGDQPPGTIGSDSLGRQFREAARDDEIKAVVLRIDSGGGSAFASEEIRAEMMALREAGKPVVVSMGDVAASGGYWIAMGADEVWAYPTTITGSIGVFGFLPTFQDSLAELGVRTDGFGVTPLAGAFRIDRALPESARRVLQASVEHTYREFLELVGGYRGMATAAVDEVAQGRVWTGAQAFERGLIDQLGTLDEAVAAAARIAGLGEDYQHVYIEPRVGAFERWVARLAGNALALVDLQLRPWWRDLPGAEVLRSLRTQLALVLDADSSRPGRPVLLSHCLCEPPR